MFFQVFIEGEKQHRTIAAKNIFYKIEGGKESLLLRKEKCSKSYHTRINRKFTNIESTVCTITVIGDVNYFFLSKFSLFPAYLDRKKPLTKILKAVF
jgi:hypothetical protein